MSKLGDQIGVPFRQEEYDARLRKIRQFMEDRGIEILLIREPINVFYLTGYNTFGISNYQILFVPLEGDITLLVRRLEKPIAFSTSWLQDVLEWDDHEDPFIATKRVMAEKGWMGKRIGFEKSCRFLSTQDFEKLKNTLAIELLDGSGIVEEARMIKSQAEIDFIRKSARLTEIGMKAGMDRLSPGKTENDIAAKVFEAMIAAGSEYPSLSPIVTAGWKSGVPHTTFFRLKLKEGDPVLFEIGSNYNRYNAALMRSAIIGKGDPEINRMNDVCSEALQAAIDTIKPGVTSGEVDEACRKVIEQAGYEENFRKRTGYSVGCSYPPDWGEGHIIDLKKDDSRYLQTGMVFHMPPALRKLNHYGVGVSETVLVTREGCEVLTNFPRELFIAR